MWLYISYEYLLLTINPNEVGSSTMPHKVNPINFENAEGNLLLANTLLEFLSRKLPISRLQRDLTDSTLVRNIGTAYGHIMIGLNNITAGLKKINVNMYTIKQDHAKYQVVLIEGIQTILRKYKYTDAYEKCKEFTRTNAASNILDLEYFVETLDIGKHVRSELNNMLNIETYTGNSKKI